MLDMLVYENITLPGLRRALRGGVDLSRTRELAIATDAAGQVGLSASRLESRTGDLSGGNQQKVSVAKWIAAGARVVIVDEPTVGVNVAAKEEIYDVISRIAASGAAVLVISSELEEVVRLSNRIGVMVDGELHATLDNTYDYTEMGPRVMHEVTRTSTLIGTQPAGPGR
jgi:ribose transport system ATP-binding protein